MAGFRGEMGHFTSHQRRNGCNEIIQTFLTFVVNRAREVKDAFPEGWTEEAALRVHQAVAAVLHEIQSNWTGIRLCNCMGDECKCKRKPQKVGMLEVVQMHQLHFTLRDSMPDFYWAAHDDPQEEAMYYHMDFLQHKSLPMGPDETSE